MDTLKNNMKNKNTKIIIILIILTLIIFFSLIKSVNLLLNKYIKEKYIFNANLIANTLCYEHINNLKGNETDLKSHHYISLKKTLQKIIKNQDKYKIAYILKLNDKNQVYFAVDSEQENSKFYSPPGDIYYECPEKIKEIFNSNHGKIIGPYKDRWGNWVSVIQPIFYNDKVIALLGLDFFAKDFLILRNTIYFIFHSFIFFLFLVLFLLFFNIISSQNLKAIQGELQSFLDNTDAGIVYYKYIYDSKNEQIIQLEKIMQNKAYSNIADCRLLENITTKNKEQQKELYCWNLIEKVLQVIKTNNNINFEHFCVITKRYYNINIFKIAENQLGMLYTDITENKNIQIEFSKSQKLTAIGQLAAGIAHEINTPMQFISDSIYFIKDSFKDFLEYTNKLDDIIQKPEHFNNEKIEEIKQIYKKIDIEFIKKEVPEAIDRIIEGSKRVTNIVQAMKTFSYKGPKEKKLNDINKAISNTLIITKNEYKYVAEVETNFGDIPSVLCNIDEINQVLLNLIINAAHSIEEVYKNTGKKGKIIIDTYKEDKFVVIKIKDTGTGIPEKYKDRIFEPFFTTKESGKGTGQGLAISKKIIEEHSGIINFETEEGKGTTFYIKLPLQ